MFGKMLKTCTKSAEDPERKMFSSDYVLLYNLYLSEVSLFNTLVLDKTSIVE